MLTNPGIIPSFAHPAHRHARGEHLGVRLVDTEMSSGTRPDNQANESSARARAHGSRHDPALRRSVRISVMNQFTPRSTATRRTPVPPVGWCTVNNHACGELDFGKVAELPELLRGTAVLEDDLVGVKGIELAGPKTVNTFAHALDKFGQRDS
jgi:hypothetical protein